MAEELDLPVYLEPGLGELTHPDWTAGPPTVLSLEELHGWSPAFAPSHVPVRAPVYPETIEDAFERSTHTAEGIIDRYAGAALLVGHATSVIGIVRGLTGDRRELHCPVASLFRLERIAGAWSIALDCDTSHLEAAVAADRFH